MVSAVIVMAGKASRMKMNQNKAFLPLGGKMVFMYSVDLFLSLGYEVILVCRDEDINYINSLNLGVKAICGGKSRSESVYNGVLACSGDKIIVHDAARPFVGRDIVVNLVDSISDGYVSFVGVSSIDTLRMDNGSGFTDLDRSKVYRAQTPQGAYKNEFILAYEKEKNNGFLSTDEVMLLKNNNGLGVKVVDGSEDNFKITTKKDYYLAKMMVGDLID